MIKKIKFYDEYKVASNDVYLNVVSGEGQLGDISVRLGDKTIKEGTEIKSELIGNGDIIKNKKLKITVLVQDMLINTDNTSVTFALSGGVSDYEHICSGKANADMGNVYYEIYIQLN